MWSRPTLNMEFSSTYQSSDVRCDDLFFILLGHICQIQAKIEHGPSIENKHWAMWFFPFLLTSNITSASFFFKVSTMISKKKKKNNLNPQKEPHKDSKRIPKRKKWPRKDTRKKNQNDSKDNVQIQTKRTHLGFSPLWRPKKVYLILWGKRNTPTQFFPYNYLYLMNSKWIKATDGLILN